MSGLQGSPPTWSPPTLLLGVNTLDGGEYSSPPPTGSCLQTLRRSRWPRLRGVAQKTSSSKPLQRNWPKLVAPELAVARTGTVALRPLRREGALSLAAEQATRTTTHRPLLVDP